jgi:biotin carboxyl carrier protein
MVEVLQGERLTMVERVIVAPRAGVFRPHADAPVDRAADGLAERPLEIWPGEPIGLVEGPGTSEAVCSPFRGRVMGMLAEAGERVRAGQPVAWLRIA